MSSPSVVVKLFKSQVFYNFVLLFHYTTFIRARGWRLVDREYWRLPPSERLFPGYFCDQIGRLTKKSSLISTSFTIPPNTTTLNLHSIPLKSHKLLIWIRFLSLTVKNKISYSEKSLFQKSGRTIHLPFVGQHKSRSDSDQLVTVWVAWVLHFANFRR